jgi:uncharacterized membrane protein YgcG
MKVKYLAFTVLLLLLSAGAKSQAPSLTIPELGGNVNDLEGLFTDAQKSQLDSVCTLFAYKTNIPIAVVTFGAANTTKENQDWFERF